MDIILGLAVVYVWIHLIVLLIDNTKWKKKNLYEKFIMISAPALFIMVLVGLTM